MKTWTQTKRAAQLGFGDVVTFGDDKIVVVGVKAAPHGHGQLVFLTGYDVETKRPFADFIGHKSRLLVS